MEFLWLESCHSQRTSRKGFVDARNVIPNPNTEELMTMIWILEKYYIIIACKTHFEYVLESGLKTHIIIMEFVTGEKLTNVIKNNTRK